MAINNYDGFLKYKQDNGDIAVLYPKTKVANVEGAATAASVTALTGRVDAADANITQNTHDIADHGTRLDDLEAADTALDTRVKTLESGAHNPPQLYVSDTEPEALKARDWWFDTSAT